MAVSLAKFGIRVNAVSPGRIKATHENQEADKNGDEWGIGNDDVETHLSNRSVWSFSLVHVSQNWA